MKKVSQEQIAKELNISRATVSRVLSNSGLVTEETRKLVMEAVERLNYKPNVVAQELAKKRKTKIVVFYMKIWRSSFVHDLLRGIRDAIEEYKAFDVHMDLYGIESETEDFFSEIQNYITDHRIDGMILMSGYENSKKRLNEFSEIIRKKGIQLVSVDTDILEEERLCFIGEEYKVCGKIAADLFNKLTTFRQDKHTLAVIVPAKKYESSELRAQGFLEAINDCYDVNIFRVQKVKDSGEEVKRILSEHPEVECIFSSIDTSTIAKILKEERKRGIVLIGCDITEEIVEYIRSGWITFVVLAAAYEQGRKALTILLDKLLMNTVPKQDKEILGFSILTKENI